MSKKQYTLQKLTIELVSVLLASLVAFRICEMLSIKLAFILLSFSILCRMLLRLTTIMSYFYFLFRKTQNFSEIIKRLPNFYCQTASFFIEQMVPTLFHLLEIHVSNVVSSVVVGCTTLRTLLSTTLLSLSVIHIL